jgi:hypothetical protein
MEAPADERTPLELGVVLALVFFGLAGLLGLIAVFDAESVVAAFGVGFGVATLIFLAGATAACALACLRRGRLEVIALSGIVMSGLALDLLVLAILLDIDDDGYARITGVAFVWGLAALIVLGLALAVGTASDLARLLYLGTGGVTIVAGAIATWLVLTTGSGDVTPTAGPIPVGPNDSFDEGLLRVLGACAVVGAALWFATLAASRLERPLLRRGATTA